jgi:hypothetical protein
MFDNLRQKSAEQAEIAAKETAAPGEKTVAKSRTRAAGKGLFLGLTPAQRLLLALMLFLNVTVLGCFALLVFGKIALPFF